MSPVPGRRPPLTHAGQPPGGKPDDRATIEVTFGGFAARVRGGGVDIAVTGADTTPSVNGIAFGINSIQHVRDGDIISMGIPVPGSHVSGPARGLDVTPVLGSRSYDVMSGIGPPPLRPGDVLPVGGHTDDYPELEQARSRRSRSIWSNCWWCRAAR
ncbi:allophanate hydrolase subunit 2 [Mycobacterium xenopi 4042]|uniref:Allophanate hydrolase subunit 2 n=1 Tax=Mycobacterium xenopi 4042 TaxID=1299334 RepID=X7Z9U0_MYCXE|nr:allophanate hydrolase subunit 2 [Mycobacterium xenopi 4042]